MPFIIMGVARTITDQQVADEATGPTLKGGTNHQPCHKSTHVSGPCVPASRRTAEQVVAEGIKLGYYPLRCEAPREKPFDVKQCFTCNGFVHIARERTLDQACARCGPDGHTREKCQAESPKCSNCGEQHGAKYGGCKTGTQLAN